MLFVIVSSWYFSYYFFHLYRNKDILSENKEPQDFPEIKDLLSHYSSFDLPTHDLKLTVAATYR